MTEKISRLRQRMIEDMNARNLSAGTQRAHIRSCKRFAAFLKRSPETANREDLRRFQLHLAEEKVSICTRNVVMTGLRFLFRVTLRRLDLAEEIYHLSEPQKIPQVLSVNEASRISQFQGSIKRAGSPVGNLTGGSATYSNNLEKIETIRDDGLIEGADPTIAALTGRIDVRFADTTLVDFAANGTPVDLEFAYTLSAQSKLVLAAHEVYLPKPKLAIEGPGGVQASFDFQGARNDVAGRMLTVTLTNDLDGTVYT